MKKVLDIQVDPVHKSVKCVIVWCYDPRFYESLGRFTADYLGLAVGEFDPVLGAGGAKGIGNPEDDHERPYLLKQIRISVTKHHASTIYLCMHANCAMYGSPEFPSSEEEQRFFTKELRLAKDQVSRFLLENPEIQNFLTEKNLELPNIVCILASFDGIYQEIS